MELTEGGIETLPACVMNRTDETSQPHYCLNVYNGDTDDVNTSIQPAAHLLL